MKGASVAPNLMPILSRGQLPAGDGRDDSARAWQREMERAQMEAWLSHAVIAASSAAQPTTLIPPLIAVGGGLAASGATGLPSEICAVPGGLQPKAEIAAIDGGAAAIEPGERVAVALVPQNAVPVTGPAPTLRDLAPPGRIRTPSIDPLRGLENVPRPPANICPGPAPMAGDPTPAGSHVAVAQVRTAELASLMEGMGRVEVTSSISGQPQPKRVQSSPLAFPEAGPGHTQIFDEPVRAPGTSFPSPVPLIAFSTLGTASPTSQVHASTLPAVATATVPTAPQALSTRHELAMTLAPAAPTAPTEPAAAQAQTLKSNASAAIRESGPGLGVAMRAVPQEPIRLHAEWSEEGVRLWLGMDSALPETLQGIAAQLQRWLSAQGVRLLSISCNGQRISDGRAATAVDMIETEPYPHESTPTQSNRFNLREIP